MIALQVAAGIVLAYLIIVNQKKLLALGGWVLGALATMVAIGALIWAGVAAVQFAGSAISPKMWEKLWTLVGVIPVFILAFTAMLGMLLLAGLLVGRKPEAMSRGLFKALEVEDGKEAGTAGCIGLIGLGIAMMLVNYAISFPVWAFTPVGSWYEAVDAYGRSHDWKDGLSVFFGALLWQWVWIPLGIHFGVKRLRAGKPQRE